MKRISVLIVSAVFVAGVLGGCGEENTQSNSPSAQNSLVSNVSAAEGANDAAAGSKYYFKNNVLQAEDVKIEIKEYKVIPPGEAGNEYGDKPVIAFWYNTTNITGKEIDPSTAWIAMFEAVQDNNPNAVNKLEVGMLPDDKFSDTQLEKIKKGGTVENAIAYELDDLETPITLSATRGLGGEELGSQTFEVKR